MSNPTSLDDFLIPNPDYGKGRLRRRILLRKTPDKVIGELEDHNHAFRVRLHHNNSTITSVSGDAIRYPNTTCPGAVNLLQQLKGTPLGKGPRALAKTVEPKSFCTHLFDLACLAYHHISKPEQTRQFDAIIEDENNDLMDIRILINDTPVFEWQLKKFIIQSEGPWQGVNIQKGFSRWAAENLNDEQFEAALTLAKTVYVSNSRRIHPRSLANTQNINAFMPKGICYAYREPVIQETVHLDEDVTIDYSDQPDKLLAFSETL